MAHVAGSAPSGRYVALGDVIHHHTVGTESPAERPDRALHAFNPVARQTVAVPLIVKRNHFLAQHAIKIFAIARIVDIHIAMGAAIADSESI